MLYTCLDVFLFFFSWRLRWTIIRLDCEWFFWLDFHDAFVGSWQYIRRSYYLLKVYLQINKWKIISIFRTSVLDNYQMQRMDELKKKGHSLVTKIHRRSDNRMPSTIFSEVINFAVHSDFYITIKYRINIMRYFHSIPLTKWLTALIWPNSYTRRKKNQIAIIVRLADRNSKHTICVILLIPFWFWLK